MKIYFAGSIYGRSEDKEWYSRIVSFLRQHGAVLTEGADHISTIGLGEKPKSVIIYERDTRWIAEADVLVAEVTTPSLEVGYEIGLAEKLGKPVLCLFRQRDHEALSPIIVGNRNLVVRQYLSLIDIENDFQYFLEHPRG